MNHVNFNFSTDDLDEIIEILEKGLALRPEPAGRPFYDLETAMAAANDYFQKLRDVDNCRGRLSGSDLLDLATGMIEGYHRLWESPFPKGLEAGQILFSAILERPMRDLLRGLTALRAGEFTGHEPPLLLDAQDEVLYFTDWADSLPSRQGRAVTRKQNFGYGSLAASFLLGWWFGSE